MQSLPQPSADSVNAWQSGTSHLATADIPDVRHVSGTPLEKTCCVGRLAIDPTGSLLYCAQVVEVSGTEVICQAQNDAVLGGLLTVFHTERSSSGLTNVQNELPVRMHFSSSIFNDFRPHNTEHVLL